MKDFTTAPPPAPVIVAAPAVSAGTLQALSLQEPDSGRKGKSKRALASRRFSTSSVGIAIKSDVKNQLVKSMAAKIVRSWNTPVKAVSQHKFASRVRWRQRQRVDR
jgi:hypothetical protein